jgi:hypothetical protein
MEPLNDVGNFVLKMKIGIKFINKNDHINQLIIKFI